MTPVSHQDLVRRYYDILSSGEWDRLNEVLVDDYVDHAAWKNIEGLRKTMRDLHASYAGFHIVTDDIFGEGDRVVVRSTAGGTRDGKPRTIRSIVIYRIAGGKIAESWGHSDSFF